MKERVSALMDDSLEEDAATSLFDRIRSDNEASHAWHTYHLIGDSIRGDADLHANLLARVMSRIESEPTVLAPARKRAASNARLRWALPLAASVMGVGAVAWVSQSLNQQSASREAIAHVAVPPVAGAPIPQIASVAAVASAAPETLASGLVIPVQATFGREYLIAHQAYSPGATMSGVAQYMRTVSESRDESTR
jgi:sigma-E factor negative regulatory protein RseA